MFKYTLVSVICICILSVIFHLQGHPGHFEAGTNFLTQMQTENAVLTKWLNHIGRYHLLMIHFPIALVVMTAAAEWLWVWFKNSLFDHAARFMIVLAAIFALPTALFGIAFGYNRDYEGVHYNLFLWHCFFGLLTAALAIIAAILRERFVRGYSNSLFSYYICLLILFLSVSLTGAFGGGLTFGLDVW